VTDAMYYQIFIAICSNKRIVTCQLYVSLSNLSQILSCLPFKCERKDYEEFQNLRHLHGIREYVFQVKTRNAEKALKPREHVHLDLNERTALLPGEERKGFFLQQREAAVDGVGVRRRRLHPDAAPE
jgi:hypothetical protein